MRMFVHFLFMRAPVSAIRLRLGDPRPEEKNVCNLVTQALLFCGLNLYRVAPATYKLLVVHPNILPWA